MRFTELVSSGKPPKPRGPLINTNNCPRNNAEIAQRFKNNPEIPLGSHPHQNNQIQSDQHPSSSSDLNNSLLHRPVAKKLSPGYRHPELTGFPESSVRLPLSKDNQPIVMIPTPKFINSEQSGPGSN